MPDGSCVDDGTDLDCENSGGTFQGVDVSCDSAECPQPTGACCVEGFECRDTTEADCETAEGVFQGLDTACEDRPYLCDCVDCEDNEGEPDGGCADEYVDTFNAGCNSNPPSYSSIECGDSVCGESGTFDSGGAPFRDTDWYFLSTTSHTAFRWEATGGVGLPIQINILDLAPGCGSLDESISTFADPCDTASLTSECLPPGDYAFFLAPNAFFDVGCGLRYEASLSCEPCGGACCVPNDGCRQAGEVECGDLGGEFLGVGTECTPESCPQTGACCVANPSCEELTEENCSLAEGIFLGEGSTCVPDACVPDRMEASTKGSLLLFSKVEVKWNSSGVVTQDTILELTNDGNSEVCVQLYLVNGDAPMDAIFAGSPPMQVAEGEPGWNWVDCSFCMTKDHPIYWSAATGAPGVGTLGSGGGCQPWDILDPAGMDGVPGRPDPTVPGGKVLRGFVYGWAVDLNGCQIRWNHLSGSATLVNYVDTSAWEYNAWASQVNPAIPEGAQVGPTCGRINLDGLFYEAPYDLLLYNFFASGSTALSRNPNNMVSVDSSLTLHPVSVDVRQDSQGPITTKAHIDIWNQNEAGRSGTTRCITCWDQTLLSQYGNPNNFLLNNLGTDKGKARINGMRSNVCDVNCFADRRLVTDEVGIEDILDLLGIDWVCSYDAALMGVEATYLSFTGASTGREAAGTNLFGMGLQRAFIKYDLVAPPGELTGESSTEVRGDRGTLKTKSIETGRSSATDNRMHLGTTPQR